MLLSMVVLSRRKRRRRKWFLHHALPLSQYGHAGRILTLAKIFQNVGRSWFLHLPACPSGPATELLPSMSTLAVSCSHLPSVDRVGQRQPCQMCCCDADHCFLKLRFHWVLMSLLAMNRLNRTLHHHLLLGALKDPTMTSYGTLKNKLDDRVWLACV